MKKKISFVLYNLSAGGSERVISLLANSFCEKYGIDVQLIFLWDKKIEYPLCSGIKISCIEENVKSLPMPLAILRRISFIKEKAREFQSDVVISFLSQVNMYCCVALKSTGIPLFISERNNPLSNPERAMERRMRNIVYNSYGFTGAVFQTDFALQYFEKSLSRAKRQNFTIIENPVSKSLPPPFAGQRRRVIVAVGRLVKQKNYPVLLRAFKGIDESYTLEIYGVGELLPQLEKLCEELNITQRVKFMGKSPEIYHHIRDCSLFVLTSDYEGMPNVLIEAMSMGIPCVSTDFDGVGSVMKNGYNGLVCRVNDADDLQNKMEMILKDEELSTALAQNAALTRTAHDEGQICDKWLGFIFK